jgi:hypothetical protein
MARCSQSQQKGPCEYTSNYGPVLSLFENFCMQFVRTFTSLSHTMFKKRPFVFKFYNYNWLIRAHPPNPPPPLHPAPYRSDKNRTKTLMGVRKEMISATWQTFTKQPHNFPTLLKHCSRDIIWPRNCTKFLQHFYFAFWIFYVPLPYILHLTDSCPFSK